MIHHPSVSAAFPTRYSTALLLASLAATHSALAQHPSFDCAKADGTVEELICSDEDLGMMDRHLAETYRVALTRYPDSELANVKAYQRGWVKGRNDCWKADDVRQCVEDNYRSRITELQITSGQLLVPSPMGYECDGGTIQSIMAVFYNDSEIPAAVLTATPGDQVLAYIVPGGSGARYEGQNVSFWTKGEEAQVNWQGTELSCHLR